MGRALMAAPQLCGATTLLRTIQAILALTLMSALSGCFGPDYGPTYGYPTYGYSPYSYGVPVYAGGYAPTFAVHHPWEEHHGEGHHESFYHSPPAPRLPGPHVGYGPHPSGPHAGGPHPAGPHDHEHH
jgi:hypothetical protein